MADLKTYDVVDMTPLLEYIREHGAARHYRRGQHFARLGSLSTELGLVISGGFAFQHPDHKGDNQILSLALDGEIIGTYITPGCARHSVYEITALCESEALIAPKNDAMEYLDRKFPGYRLEFTTAISYGIMQRAISYRCDSPEMRYRELLERMPGISDRISMTAIASYLGITRETFARMRKKLQL